MKKLSWILTAIAAAGVAGAASKRLRGGPMAPEGSWKDVSPKPSTNGSNPV